MAKVKLFKVETGVLLDEHHPEFGVYREVYTKRHGFYDTNNRIFRRLKDAKQWADSCIQCGGNKTYAVITSAKFSNNTKNDSSIIEDLIDGDIHESFIDSFGYKERDIIYFAFKDNKTISVMINKRSGLICKK